MAKQKSVQISKEEKKQIVSGLIKNSKVAKARADIASTIGALALNVRDATLGAHKDALLSVPEDWVNRRAGIELSGAPGGYSYLDFIGGVKPCPIRTANFADLPKGLQNKVSRALEKKSSIEREYNDLRSHVKSIVYGAGTTGRLLELLPEAEQHFPLSLQAKINPAQLPAIPSDHITAIRKKLAA